MVDLAGGGGMKMLKTVGMVVGAVALVATGVGLALGGAAGAGAFLGASAATWTTIGAVAGVASGVIGLGSALLYKPPAFGGGNPQQFQTNPQSGLPYCVGRTAMSGVRIHADTASSPGWDKDDILGFAALLHAGGEIQQIEQFTADNQAISFDGSGQATTAPFSDSRGKWMAQKLWLGGAMASALALSLNGAAMPGWTSGHRLSGMAHGLWMLRFDTKGHHYDAGVPQPRWIGKWAKVYDPRLDSTYPGGSGSCRALDETTYVWSRNPALHALTWCLGRWQNGKRVLGIGAPVEMIRTADFVEAANVADANGWHAGGVAWTTDSKWNVLKGMLQAGGAVPTMNGAMIGCRAFAPRVSIATIASRHLIDGLDFSATKSRRERINSIIPRYRSEAHDWEVVSGTAVTVAAHVASDGGLRQRELDLPFVQNEVGQTGVDSPAQIGALCRYEIENAREEGPISFTTGPEFIGLKAGDCITLDAPEEGFAAAKIILTADPAFDPATGRISFTAETETDAKHAFALGQTSAPPPAFSLTPPDLLPAQPAAGLWTLAADIGADGLPLLRITGGARTVSWKGLVVQYRRTGATSWIMAGAYGDDGSLVVEIPGVDGAAEYEAQVAYYSGVGTGAFRTLDPATTAANGLAADAAAAMGRIDIIVSDGWLDRSEKPAVAAQWTEISSEQPVLQARAEAFGITAERATYDGAVAALAAYLSALSPAWNDASQDTAIVRATFNGKFTDVYYARQLLLDRIAAAAAAAGTGNLLIDPLTLAPFSVVSGTVVREDTGAGGPARDRYRLRLDSDGAQCVLQQTPIPVRPGETIFVEAAMFTTGAPSGAAGEAGLLWYDAAGAYVGGNAVAVHSGASASVWTVRRGSITVPTGVATALPFFQRSGGAGGHFHLSEPYIGRQQAGADVTGANTAANTAAVGSTPATTVESGANAANAGVNADGTIKNDKVDTPAVIADAIVAPPAGIVTSGTFSHTGWSTRGSVSYAPYSGNSNLLIFIAGIVTIGDASGAGTYAEVRLLKDGLQIFGPVTISRTRGGEQVFSFPISESGWTGAQTLELQYRASATHGGGDPHLVDSSTIRILEGKNA